jgi:hypothetical protein
MTAFMVCLLNGRDYRLQGRNPLDAPQTARAGAPDSMGYQPFKMRDALPIVHGPFRRHVTTVLEKPEIATFKRVCNGAELLAPSAKSLDPRIR